MQEFTTSFPAKAPKRETISHKHRGKKAEQLEVLSTRFVNTSLCGSVYSSLPFVDQDKIFCFPTHCQIPALLNTQEMLVNIFRRKSSKKSKKTDNRMQNMNWFVFAFEHDFYFSP